MKNKKVKSILVLVGAIIFAWQGALAQTFAKVSTVNFPFVNTTPQDQNLIVKPNVPTAICYMGVTPVLKKATINAILDWKGNYTDVSAAQYSVAITINGYVTYPGGGGLPTSMPIVTYTQTLLIDKNKPQSYFTADFTGLHASLRTFRATVTYTRTGSSEPVVEALMSTNVYYTEEFEYNAGIFGTPTIALNPVTYLGTETKFSWASFCVPAPNFEFQLLRLFNTSSATSSLETTITPYVDWSKALSIETGNSLQELKLTLTEGNGYYLWRVRPIGNSFEGGFGDSRNWGDWTDQGTYATDGLKPSISSGTSPYLFYYNQFDNDKNWIFTRTFIEGDVVNKGQINIGEAISYANGLQMAQQQQARAKTSEKLITNQTIYDHSGRPALTSMAAPVSTATVTSSPNSPFVATPGTLGYISSYIKDVAGASYSAADFDEDINYENPPKIDTTTDGTGKYYSYGNSIETNVATAAGRPYSRTLYMRDGTSKPKEQSAPGAYHKLGHTGTDKHTTRNYTSSTTDNELIRVFGDEAPTGESVLKSMTTDANNETSISYVSKEGNTIATCLSADKAPNLDVLPNLPAPFALTYHINNNTPYGANGIRAFKTIVLTSATPTVCTLSYQLTPKVFDDLCLDFCATCDYKVTIKIINNDDPDGTTPAGAHPADQVFILNPSGSSPTKNLFGSCSPAVITNPSGMLTTVTLNAGSYTVERIVESNQVDPNPLSSNIYPAVLPATDFTPYVDQYLKHIDEMVRDKYSSSDPVTITVYNNTNSPISTTLYGAGMAGILSYLQSTTPGFVPDIAGLYAALGISSSTTVSSNPDHFKITPLCGDPLILPVAFCDEAVCPTMVASPLYPGQNVYDFEKYYTDWYLSVHGTTTTITSLFSQYAPGEFNVVVTNMINAGACTPYPTGLTIYGYDCKQLLQNFKTTYMLAGNTLVAALPGSGAIPTIPGVAPPTGIPTSGAVKFFDTFMSNANYGTTSGGGVFTYVGTGYQITAINNNVGGLGCASLGYKFHPYRFFKYDNAVRCLSCEFAYYTERNGATAATALVPTLGAWPTNYTTAYPAASNFETYFNGGPATMAATSATIPAIAFTLYPWNDFYTCFKNCAYAPTGTTTASTFATGSTATCEQVCEDRYPLFVSDLIDAYHQDGGREVQGDPFDLVSSGGIWVYGPTVHIPSGTDVSLATIYCQVENLIAGCKTNCSLTVQPDGSLGNATELYLMTKAMYGTYVIEIYNSSCTQPAIPSSASTQTFDVVAYVDILNSQLALERNNSPSAGFYWKYTDFLTAIGASVSLSGCSANNYAFVHPDIPAYFEYDVSLSKIVYYFNKVQAGMPGSTKRIFSSAALSVIPLGGSGAGFIYSGTPLTPTSLTVLSDDVAAATSSYLIDNTFQPTVTALPSVTAFKTLINAGVIPGSPANLRDYNNTQNGYWKMVLCPTIPVPTYNVACDPVCYHILSPEAVDITDPGISDEVIMYTLVSCNTETANDLLNAINDQVNIIASTQVAIMKQRYHAQCVDLITDDLTFSYSVLYYHYTLYTYDRAGNLMKTVPPEGIKYTDASSALLTTRSQHSDHGLSTEYAYNSLAQLVRQKTPDGGQSVFYYDSKARLRFSQNARQLANLNATSGLPDPLMSYTKYDQLGRIIEVGEKPMATAPTAIQLDDPLYPATGTDVTRTVYSQAVASATYFGNLPQRFLQNRVSYSATDKDGLTATTSDQVVTFYSYDPHGNVEWLLQSVPEIGRSYVGYEYDLISGSVIKVKYNEGLSDKFFHRYTYDIDKRIQTAETSEDGFFWIKEATYDYYLHGPLKRTVLGKDKVQGQDYVYTLQGWLKGLNHTSRTYDPGHDSDVGTNFAVAQDAYSMILSYHHGDFMNNTSKFNSDETSNSYFLHEPGSTRELYNGNISTWANKYNYEAITRVSAGFPFQNMDVATGRTFHYDELNRIKSAEYHTFNETTFIWGGNSADYHEDFSYDANGNIKTLNRTGYSNSGIPATALDERKMDAMTYSYYGASNKLSYVDDTPDVYPTRYSDVKDQSSTNYVYDLTGNLVSDAQEGISKITWNVYGKIASIAKTDGTLIEFLYDAAGRRVYKKVFNTTDIAPNLTVNAKTTYYSLDATGNAMAVYGRSNTYSSGVYYAAFTLKEQGIYGSDRLGVRTDPIVIRSNVSFAPPSAPLIPAATALHSGSFNNTIATENFFVSMVISTFPPFVIVATKGATAKLTTSVLPVSGAALVAPLYGIAGTNSAVYEDDCGYIIFKSMVMQNYNGSPNVPLVYGKTGGLYNTVGLKDYYKGKSMFMRNPANPDEYYYFTIGIDKKPYYHIFNAVTGLTVSLNNPMDAGSNYQFSMAILEDRVGPGASQVYLKRLAVGGNVQLVRFSVTLSGVSAPIVVSTTHSGDESVVGYSEMQVNRDGDKLLVGNNRGTPNIFGFYSTGGQLVQYNLSTNHVPTYGAATYAYLPNTACRSFDYTPTGANIIFQNFCPTPSVTLQRISSTFAATTFTYGSSMKGDIRRGKNGYVYLANTVTNSFIELRNVDITTWTLIPANVVTVPGTAGQFVTGGLSLNRHLVHNNPPCLVANSRVLGNELYELKDHLGNVHAVITDRKVSVLLAGVHDHFISDVSSVQDYYSFGMLMPGRTWPIQTAPDNTSAGTKPYRYGFNGQESDYEVNNKRGTSNSAEFWQYDPRLGRRWNLDPKPTVGISQYAAFANSPIWFSDPLGDTVLINLFAKDDKVFYDVAEKMVFDKTKNDGYFIIAGHADPEHYENNTGNGEFNLKTPEQFDKLLKSYKEWEAAKASKIPITLILAGCNTATVPAEYFEKKREYTQSLTQRLSAADVDITVKGANGYCHYGFATSVTESSIVNQNRWGLKFLSKKGLEIDSKGNRSIKKDGNWSTYKAGKKLKSVSWAPEGF